MRRMQQGFVPCKNDKPKNAEISPFKAGSDYSLSATGIILTGIVKGSPLTIKSVKIVGVYLDFNSLRKDDLSSAFN